MKYIVVTGGSFSGIGKGLLSSSIGVILQSCGYTVTFLKIDPYLNYSAGKLEPSEHGETFVLVDGTEADLDLGNYQRFCNVVLTSKNILTSGKILYDIIDNEKNGSYNGKTLRFCTDFNRYILERLETLEKTPACTVINNQRVYKKPDVLIIELGGTVVDDESFFLLKSLSRIFEGIKKEDKCFITIDYMVEMGDIVKTKLLQNSLNTLKTFGIKNDIMVYRGNREMNAKGIDKISENCGIKNENIIWSREISNQYDIPKALFDQGLYRSIQEVLQLNNESNFNINKKFNILTTVYNQTKKIGIISRYYTNDQPYTSLEDALIAAGKHKGWDIEIIVINYMKLAEDDEETFKLLKSVDGIIIPGGFGDLNVETKLMVAQYARTNDIPFLGICLGFQIMVVEFARNVMGIVNATSEEFSSTSSGELLIRKHPNIVCFNTKEDIFLGEYKVEFGDIFKTRIIKKPEGNQIFRHRYSFNPKFEDIVKPFGLTIEGKTKDDRVAAVCLGSNSFHVGVQYHPELSSMPDCVDPVIDSFVDAIIFCSNINN